MKLVELVKWLIIPYFLGFIMFQVWEDQIYNLGSMECKGYLGLTNSKFMHNGLFEGIHEANDRGSGRSKYC